MGLKSSPSGSFLLGNTGALQAHTSLDKANTMQSSWTLEADTATSAFGCSNGVVKNAAGIQTLTTAGCYKIDTNGNPLGLRFTLSVEGRTLVFR